MKICSERFMKRLENHENEDLLISEFVEKLSIDLLGNCVFGFTTDMQSDVRNPFFEKTNHLLELSVNYDGIFLTTSKLIINECSKSC